MGSDGTMLNPIFWKKVQEQKHPGRWEIAERKIPCVKMAYYFSSRTIIYSCGELTPVAASVIYLAPVPTMQKIIASTPHM